MFSKFLLTLCLRVPASSGFLVYWQRSPVVVIDRYTGEFDDARAPAWLQAQQPEYRFWQPRSLMLDLILYFVANVNASENAGLASEVDSWCKALSVSGIFCFFIKESPLIIGKRFLPQECQLLLNPGPLYSTPRFQMHAATRSARLIFPPKSRRD